VRGGDNVVNGGDTGNAEQQISLSLQVLASQDLFPKRRRETASRASFGHVSDDDDHTDQQLILVKECVMMYMDDINPDIRKKAALTCLSVLDSISMGVNPGSDEIYLVISIIDRLLLLGVSDDVEDIRVNVFNGFTVSLDNQVAQSQNLNCLVEALNDEFLDVRAAAMSVLSRVAHFDSLHIMPIIRVIMKRLISQLQHSKDSQLRHESVHLLQALVRGSSTLIVPYLNQILEPLMSLLDDPSPAVVGAALSTVGELSVASPETVRRYLEKLFPRLIGALTDTNAMETREIAVVSMGKLFSSLALLTNSPYTKFPELFGVIVSAIQCEDEGASELRLQAIRTAGLLGAVDPILYQSHLRAQNKKSVEVSEKKEELLLDEASSESHEDSGDTKPMTKIERYYFSVVMRELVACLLDSSLTSQHQTALGIAFKAVRHVGPQCISLIDELIDGISARIFSAETGSSMREAFLETLTQITGVIGRRMKKYLQLITDIVTTYISEHLDQCLEMIEAVYATFSLLDFNNFILNVMPGLLDLIRLEQTADEEDDVAGLVSAKSRSKSTGAASQSVKYVKMASTNGSTNSGRKKKLLSTISILHTIANIRDALGEYKRQLMHIVIQLFDKSEIESSTRVVSLKVFMQLTSEGDIEEFGNRLIHPLMRVLSSADSDATILNVTFTTLSTLVCKLGLEYTPYIIPVRRSMAALATCPGSQRDEYEGLVSRLLKQQPLPSECGGADDLILAKRSGFKRVRAQSEPALNVGMNALETAWALANTDSASDLTDWMQRLSIELIRQCPLPIIRMCAPLTKANKTFAEQLFNASFSCIWEVLGSGDTNEVVEDIPLINGIERALNSSNIPSHIVHVLLNLVEFMDMQDKLLPIDAQILYRQAGKANMFAKCLRYLEFEFHSPNILPSSDCIEALITVNKELGKEDRAIGVLNLVKAEDMIPVKPVWLEALNRWDEARQSYHDQYTQRYSISSMAEKDRSTRVVNELGLLRCLNALGEFEELTSSALVLKEDLKKSQTDASAQSWLTEVQNLGANAAWMLGKWDSMEEFVEAEALPDIRDVELEKNPAFYKAVFAINNQKYDHARSLITAIRSNLSESVGTLLSENYSRANRAMISMQILAELEEVVEYKEGALQTAIDDRQRSSSLVLADRPRAASTVLQDRNSDPSAGRIALMRKWRGRLKAAHIDVSMYRQILGVHMLVVEPHEDLDSWLELVHLCLKEGHFSLCGNILRRLGAPIQMSNGSSDQIADLPIKPHPRVRFATFNYWWDSGERSKALGDLGRFLSSFEVDEESSTKREDTDAFDIRLFRVECLLKRAEWMREVGESPFEDVVKTLEEARNLAPSQYSVWHAWAVTNYNQLRDVISENPQAIIEEAPAPESPRRNSSVSNPPLPLALKTSPGSSEKDRKNVSFRSRNESSHYVSTADATSDSMIRYVNEGIKGFVRSIVLGQGQPIANVLQDTLRLLTLWFTYGSRGNVCEILGKELEQVSPDNWLTVIPQLIARMHTKCGEIASLLQKLLLKLATTHPQALVCPMSVALNTENVQQKKMAAEIVKEMRKSNSSLVGEASQMSRELMKVAMSPHENWHDGLELAAQQYMEFKDTKAMTKTLLELHKALTGDTGSLDFEAEGFAIDSGKVGHTTLRDISFRQSYGRVLEDAYHWIHRYSRTEKNIDLHQAWEIYQIVFKKIKAQIQNLKTIDLLHMSPALSGMRDLSLCVPGTYKPFTNVISIKSFSSDIDVIPSKQRPRRMTIMGSDGNEYQFLLKGHEDLRQDERVMQLFGLINVCFENSRTTSSYGYSIVRYSVLPLSNDSGVIGWVEGCDTLNNLVKSYREMKNIRLNLENKLLQTKCPHYLKVPVPNKVEVFTQVLEETTGQDIAKMLWLRSKTADVWVDRRSNFTKSMAVTSIVGYILGLGDRHPSNLMVERSSGRVVHIDFGDCFEVTMKRAKFPELIPFRLTRMLTTAMGRSGTEGTYRLTCERVMRVLRDNRDSVMAMLEAFVYDPLISWRLLGDDEEEPGAKKDPDSAEAQMLNAKSRDFDSDDEDDDEGLRQSLKETILSVVGPGDDEDATGRPMNPAGTLKEIAMRNMAAAEEGGASVELEENINSRYSQILIMCSVGIGIYLLCFQYVFVIYL
jgi:FKBP12-rapamycin complex-associated protein